MHELVVAAGVAAERVFRIPIGIDIERFPLGDAAARERSRRALGLGESAFVVGSFQKDGTGWEAGLEPKLVKGPDVLVETLRRARERIPELVVLLTGPARGYVLAELARLGIPVVHTQIRKRDGLAGAYHALDTYVVASRQEGGPKSAFEALATGVPLVSTRVGQTPELVVDGEAALFADVDDAEALAAYLVLLHGDGELGRTLRENGRPVAEAHAYDRLDGRWAELFEGFVAR
jgi:glycosyltransferase involved in cell wall biosynthesis